MQPPTSYAPELVRLSTRGAEVLELGQRGELSAPTPDAQPASR